MKPALRKYLFLLPAAGILAAAGPAAADEEVYVEEDYADSQDTYNEVSGDQIINDSGSIMVQDDGTVIYWDDGTGYYDQADVPDAILIDESGETEEIEEAGGISLNDLIRADREAEEAVAKVRPFLERAQLDLPGADEISISSFLTDLEQFVSPTGSDGELLASRYIRSRMEEMGYTVSEQTFHEGFLNDDYIDVPGINLIAERGANSEFRTDDILLLCAHYDSRTNPDEGDPLANDKTGAAVLLEVARILSNVSSDVDVCFLFFSGEEDGFYGSARFLEKLDEQLKNRITSVICIGPVGYHYLPEYGPGTDPEKLSYLLGADPLPDPEQEELLSGTAAAGQAQSSDSLIADNEAAAGTDTQVPLDAIPVNNTVTELENEQGNLYRATVLLERAEMVAAGTALPEDTLGLQPRHEIALQKPELPLNLVADWTFVPDYTGCRANFMQAGLNAASLFQNLEGKYRLDDTDEIVYLPLPQEDTGLQAEEEPPTAANSDAGLSSAANEKEAAEAASLVTDPADLARIADLTARVASCYMRAL